MNHHQLQLAITAGELLLINGGEIFRVEQTIEHIAIKMGANKVDSFVTPTGLIASIEMENETFTYVRRVHSRGYNLTIVVEINDLSRRFCSGEILPPTLAARLDALRNPKRAPGQHWKMAIASGFGALGFAYILGLRNPLALLYTTINGVIVRRILDFISARARVPDALAVLISSALLTTLTFFYPNLSDVEQNFVNLGGLFLLLPGVTLSTSFRELANGDLLSGISRLAEALISLAMVAAGVITSYTLLPLLQGVLF